MVQVGSLLLAAAGGHASPSDHHGGQLFIVIWFLSLLPGIFGSYLLLCGGCHALGIPVPGVESMFLSPLAWIATLAFWLVSAWGTFVFWRWVIRKSQRA